MPIPLYTRLPTKIQKHIYACLPTYVPTYLLTSYLRTYVHVCTHTYTQIWHMQIKSIDINRLKTHVYIYIYLPRYTPHTPTYPPHPQAREGYIHTCLQIGIHTHLHPFLPTCMYAFIHTSMPFYACLKKHGSKCQTKFGANEVSWQSSTKAHQVLCHA